MANGTRNDLKRNPLSTEASHAKFSSLIHILNGEEEFALNENGFIISSNLEAANVTGYEEYEIIGKHLSIFYVPEELEKSKLDLEKTKRLGSTIITGPKAKKKGVVFWAKMKMRFVQSREPGSPSFLVVLQDATHRALSKERIRTLRDEYLAIFNNQFVGTIKFKIDNAAIQMCNLKALDILGASNSPDLKLSDFFSSSHQFQVFISTLTDNKKIEGFKFLVRRESAQPKKWAIISARYFESQGFVEGILLDITEQYMQMMELRRVNEELDNFIYHASHDLRSPLTSIMGLVNLGLKENSLESTHNYLQMIRGRVDRLDVLLKDLISVSYNNGMDRENEPFFFQRELQQILQQVDIPVSNFRINTEVSQAADFRTDGIRMRTILQNLILNALKYYNPDVAEPYLNLSIRTTQSHCAIVLRDNGIGIHPEFKNRVYDMFFRATERSAGSGLGLYIVKSMVAKLNGSVSFESTPSVGTTFFLMIPNQATGVESLSTMNYHTLTSRQIEIVQSTWERFLQTAQNASSIFYKKFFLLEPDLPETFTADIHAQAQKLVTMITSGIGKLHNLEELLADSKTFELPQKNFFARPEHYLNVASALLASLEQVLGKDWSSDVMEAWNAVYTKVAYTMITSSNRDGQ
jgi:PAS domain S-box-containing protein